MKLQGSRVSGPSQEERIEIRFQPCLYSEDVQNLLRGIYCIIITIYFQ